MSTKNKNFKPKLKSCHILLLAIILCPILISNSNSVNRRRKLKKESEFIQNLILRKLDFSSDTDAICSKGSEDLKNYYLTRDDDSIGIKNDKIESEEKEKYVDALINLVASKGDTNENIKEYVMHLIPVLVILVLAILSIPGWIILCSCSCCSCCCCCCCKKAFCKLPFFIITAVCYAFVLGISIYGLSQSDSIFVGLSDTECSILKFIDQVLSGEGENAPKPYWAGIDNIQNILTETKANIASAKTNYATDLQQKEGQIDTARTNFKSQLSTQSDNVKANKYSIDSKNYKLDIVYEFGVYSGGSFTPPDCFLFKLNYEFDQKDQNSQELMTSIKNKFSSLDSDNSADGALDEGIKQIEPIKSSIDEVKNQISGIIIDYSDTIDKYGKLAFKIVFSVLMVLDAAIAALMTVMLFFSFSCFDKCCCCCRCLLKSLVHILWNILALLTFLTLLIGFFCTLIGTLGGDLISVVSFLVSEENLKASEPILLTEGGDMLNKCINGDGDITEDLGLKDNPALKNMEDLKTYKAQLIKTQQEFNEALSTRPDYYKNFINKFNKRKGDLTTDIDLINESNPEDKLNLGEKLNSLNSGTSSKNEEWKIKCDRGYHSCEEPQAGHTDYYCIELNSCTTKSINSDWYNSVDATTIKAYAEVIDAFINSIKISKNGQDGSINKALAELDEKYQSFIEAENNNINVYKNTIEKLTNIFEEVAGGDKLLSILNCKFIGKNVRVMLRYLDKSLGKSFYNVGICLTVAGVAMFVSIAFTILLNIIINQKSK